ncbi:PD-(D/E)XK motif protein [Mucilaginibacter sp. PAMB04168]|uniref:PD-(D/E)XK motif protein n=1 Tax=Mucilaginibacter sp. PAMB04168 TaxID=3138567 RepID=UPI0031F62F4D
MMTTEFLEEKWNTIVQDGSAEFRFKKISADCIPELNIGINKLFNRCLILELPPANNVDFQGTVKQNLSIEFYRGSNYIVIQLTDNSYHDLFNDLIISLYQKIKDISDVDVYSRELIKAFYKWSGFFDDKLSDRISADIIKGLFGELTILKSLVAAAPSASINDVLNSWQGPYDRAQDFVLDDRNLEIKTKEVAKSDVRISSEFQLEPEFQKGLELVVVAVDPDPADGLSLQDLALEIRGLIVERLGDTSIFLKALAQKGLNLRNIEAYNDIRYLLISETFYNCLAEGFPRLAVSGIPQEINNLKYNIRISALDDYILTRRDY